MKRHMIRLLVVMLSACFYAGCGSSPSNASRVRAPSSQEQVQGAARIRAKAHADLGFEYYAQKQYGTALQEAKVALNDDSGYIPAYNLLALVYMSLGDPKSAEQSFLRARQLAPGDPEIANNYGWFLCQNKREPESFQYFNEALQNPLYPTPIVALNNSAECAVKMHDLKAAEGYLQRTLDLAPNSTRALMLMANLKYEKKQFNEARVYISELHRNAEPTAASSFLAYRVARLTGNRDEEARYLALLRKKFPDSEEYKKLARGITE